MSAELRLISGYSNESLEVILLLCSFSTIAIVVGFPLGLVTYLVSGSWSFNTMRSGFHLMERALRTMREQSVPLQMAPAYHAGRSPL